MELIALLIVIYLIFLLMKNIFKKLGISFLSSNTKLLNLFNPLGHFLKFLITGSSKSGLMSPYKQDKQFSSRNKGLLLDGKNKRLSLKESYNHFALISRAGGGKTTSFVIPNIYKLANEKNSMVITDISGELYEKTSGYLSSKGYKIYVLNPEDLSESIGYNPLYYIRNSTDIDKIANLLILSNKNSVSTGEAEYWESGGKNLIVIMIKRLLYEQNPKYLNLGNVRYLVNNFGMDGEALQPLFDNISDVKLREEFYALCQTNPMTLTSFVSNANVALNPIGINDNLEKLTANHTIDFERFRKEKSVIYIKIPGQEQDLYKFLLNLFYQQLFNHIMIKLPQKDDLPIFCLLDEFGNMRLPSFNTTITTIRKYEVSISIILQDIKQLTTIYGENEAETILNGGISSKLYYSGVGLKTAKELSEIIGNYENIKTDIDGNFYFKDEPIMKVNEIRTMKDDEALFISANLLPAKFEIKPYYKDFIYTQYSKMKPFKINSTNHLEDIDFIEIYQVEE